MKRALVASILTLASALSQQKLGTVPEEQSVKRKEVPKAVLSAFVAAYPKAKIGGFSRESDQGKIVYEVESKEGSVLRDVLYTPEGTVISVEESFPYADLPQLVRDGMMKEYPRGKVTRCERILKGTTTEYEVVISQSKSKYEVVFDLNGTIIKKEKL